jgi:hypothetical protein
MAVWGKERHLAFRIATIGAMRVGLNEFMDRETVRTFAGRDCQVLSDESASLRLKYGAGFKKRLDPVLAIFTAEAGVFESAPGCLRIIRHAVDHDPPGPNL